MNPKLKEMEDQLNLILNGWEDKNKIIVDYLSGTSRAENKIVKKKEDDFKKIREQLVSVNIKNSFLK